MSDAVPGISILVPTRDMNHYIPGLLENIDAQIGKDDEVLILFDGTPPDEALKKTLKRYPYARVFASKQGGGVSRARNFLAKQARHEVLRFQDCDDLLAPYAIDIARERIRELNEWRVLLGGQFNYGDKVFSHVVLNDPHKPLGPALMRTNPMVVNMCFFHKSSFLQIGGFDPKISFQEDWDLWLRYLRKWGERGFTRTRDIFGIYNVVATERAAKKREPTVDGIPVVEYLFRKSGFPPPSKDKS